MLIAYIIGYAVKNSGYACFFSLYLDVRYLFPYL